MVENRDFLYPLAFDALVRGGVRIYIAMMFGSGKLEWCGYPMVKKCEDMFIRFDTIHERDRWTDRHRTTAKAALA